METTDRQLKVFIAGSRRLSKLSRDVTRRIDNILARGLTVVVGDANGMDKAVQKYLSKRHYPNVLVYCMEDLCRNNEGGWETRRIIGPSSKRRDFAFFSAKDRAMAREADYGLMLWDGESRGTLTNIVDLVRHGKAVVVYIAPEKHFVTVKEPEQLAKLAIQVDLSDIVRVERELLTSAHTSARSVAGRPEILF
jgi:hypothetical protein